MSVYGHTMKFFVWRTGLGKDVELVSFDFDRLILWVVRIQLAHVYVAFDDQFRNFRVSFVTGKIDFDQVTIEQEFVFGLRIFGDLQRLSKRDLANSGVDRCVTNGKIELLGSVFDRLRQGCFACPIRLYLGFGIRFWSEQSVQVSSFGAGPAQCQVSRIARQLGCINVNVTLGD